MRDFKFLVNDDRYSVPTLMLVQAAHYERACELAENVLSESPHHLAVEVWENDVLLATLGELPTPDRALPSAPSPPSPASP